MASVDGDDFTVQNGDGPEAEGEALFGVLDSPDVSNFASSESEGEEEATPMPSEDQIDEAALSHIIFKRARREFMDISASYSANGMVLIDGDGLVLHALQQPLLDWVDGGQPLHLCALVVQLLDSLRHFAIPFHIVFFKCNEGLWRGASRVARQCLVHLLVQSPVYGGLVNLNFFSASSPDFLEFRTRLNPQAILTTCRRRAKSTWVAATTNPGLLKSLAYLITDGLLNGRTVLLADTLSDRTSIRLCYYQLQPLPVATRDAAAVRKLSESIKPPTAASSAVTPNATAFPLGSLAGPRARAAVCASAVGAIVAQHHELAPVARVFLAHAALLDFLAPSQRCVALPVSATPLLQLPQFAAVVRFLDEFFTRTAAILTTSPELTATAAAATTVAAEPTSAAESGQPVFVRTFSVVEGTAQTGDLICVLGDLWDGRLFLQLLLTVYRLRASASDGAIDFGFDVRSLFEQAHLGVEASGLVRASEVMWWTPADEPALQPLLSLAAAPMPAPVVQLGAPLRTSDLMRATMTVPGEVLQPTTDPRALDVLCEPRIIIAAAAQSPQGAPPAPGPAPGPAPPTQDAAAAAAVLTGDTGVTMLPHSVSVDSTTSVRTPNSWTERSDARLFCPRPAKPPQDASAASVAAVTTAASQPNTEPAVPANQSTAATAAPGALARAISTASESTVSDWEKGSIARLVAAQQTAQQAQAHAVNALAAVIDRNQGAEAEGTGLETVHDDEDDGEATDIEEQFDDHAPVSDSDEAGAQAPHGASAASAFNARVNAGAHEHIYVPGQHWTNANPTGSAGRDPHYFLDDRDSQVSLTGIPTLKENLVLLRAAIESVQRSARREDKLEKIRTFLALVTSGSIRNAPLRGLSGLTEKLEAAERTGDLGGLQGTLQRAHRQFDWNYIVNRNLQMFMAGQRLTFEGLNDGIIQPFQIFPPEDPAAGPRATRLMIDVWCRLKERVLTPEVTLRSVTFADTTITMPYKADNIEVAGIVQHELCLKEIDHVLKTMTKWLGLTDSSVNLRGLDGVLSNLRGLFASPRPLIKHPKRADKLRTLVLECAPLSLPSLFEAAAIAACQRLESTARGNAELTGQLRHGLLVPPTETHEKAAMALHAVMEEVPRWLELLAYVDKIARAPLQLPEAIQQSSLPALQRLWDALKNQFCQIGFTARENMAFFHSILKGNLCLLMLLEHPDWRSLFTLPTAHDAAVSRPMTVSLAEFQFTTFSPLLPRPTGMADTRVRNFKPDPWQRELLDLVDRRESALVCAPTSSGKTFICFYIMEKVLSDHRHPDGLVVYVCPSKALVNQVYSDILARFRKDYDAWEHRGCGGVRTSRTRELVGTFTRDYRIFEDRCQVLVTVPDCLEILLHSDSKYTTNLRYLILDEVHTISQEFSGEPWERLLLESPSPFLALSATVGNPTVFASWLREAEGRKGRAFHLIPASNTGDQRIERYNDLTTSIFGASSATLAPCNMLATLDAGVVATVGQVPHAITLLPEQVPATVRALLTVLRAAAVQKPQDPVGLLLLEARELLDVFERVGDVTPEVSQALPAYLKMKGLRQYVDSLKTFIGRLCRTHPALADQFFARLRDGDAGLAALQRDESRAPEEMAGDNETLGLFKCLQALAARNRLPAIVFRLSVSHCEIYVCKLAKMWADRQRLSELRALAEDIVADKHSSTSQTFAATFLAALKDKTLEEQPTELAALLGSEAGQKLLLVLDGVYEREYDCRRKQQANSQREVARERQAARAGGANYADQNETIANVRRTIFDVNARFTFHPSTLPTVADIQQVYRDKTDEEICKNPVLSALLRGIAFHHGQADKKYRTCVQYLFRKRKLSVVIATGTLATGINMPCRSVVLFGNSPFLNSLNFHQMIGRAGRRGFDYRGHVVLLALSREKIYRLVHSLLPQLCGNVTFTATQACRMMLSTLSDPAVLQVPPPAALQVALQGYCNVVQLPFSLKLRSEFQRALPVFFVDLMAKMRVLRATRKPVEQLEVKDGRRANAWMAVHRDEFGNAHAIAIEATALAPFVTHLFYHEPANLMFVSMLYSGMFDEMCDTGNPDLEALLHVVVSLFSTQEVSSYVLETREASQENICVPPLPPRFRHMIQVHNCQSLADLCGFMRLFQSTHAAAMAPECMLGGVQAFVRREPLVTEATAAAGTIVGGLLHAHAIRPFSLRSVFTATSGHNDEFATSRELSMTVRPELAMDAAQIPMFEAQDRLNAFMLDFFRTRNPERPKKVFGFRATMLWEEFTEFSHLLRTIAQAVFRRSGIEQVVNRCMDHEDYQHLLDMHGSPQLQADVAKLIRRKRSTPEGNPNATGNHGVRPTTEQCVAFLALLPSTHTRWMVARAFTILSIEFHDRVHGQKWTRSAVDE